MLKIGFTGTQKGMTLKQKETFCEVIALLNLAEIEFHSGDCIGADEEAHTIVRGMGIRTVGHPPTQESKRAYRTYDEVRTSRSYLSRNQEIVNETEVLIACPKEPHYQIIRSGTWSTYRKAGVKGIMRIIIWPDGSLKVDGAT